MMMDPQLIQAMAEALKASLIQDGWKAPGQQPPTSSPGVPTVSVKQEAMDTTDAGNIMVEELQWLQTFLNENFAMPKNKG